MTAERPLAVWLDPEDPGRTIELWAEDLAYVHAKKGREALTVRDIGEVVTQPDIRVPDLPSGRERLYRRSVGPTTWLSVVVDWTRRRGRVYNVIPKRRVPRRDRP